MASFRLWKSGFRENGNSAPAGSTEGGGTVLTIASLDGELVGIGRTFSGDTIVQGKSPVRSFLTDRRNLHEHCAIGDRNPFCRP